MRPRPPAMKAQAADWAQEGFLGIAEQAPVGTHGLYQTVHLPPVIASPGCAAALTRKGPGARTFATESAVPCQLRLGIYYYPWWQASDESGNALAIAKDPDGLMTIAVPAGTHTVHVLFRVHSRVRTWSAALSLAVLLLMVLAFPLVPRREDGMALAT
jgi:hypothetical protein